VRLAEVYSKYQGVADFWWVYVKEAHPVGSRRPAKHVEIEQSKTFQERLDVATKCSGEIKLSIPQLVDDIENSCATAYNALPDRLFVLSAEGRIAYRGGRGPRGFDVDAMEKSLAKLVGE
jgi:hypothetical protein